LAVDARTDEVCRHEVGRELDAPKRTPDHLGNGPHGERFGEAGHSLKQDMAAREEGDQQAFDEGVLANDDALDLAERLPKLLRSRDRRGVEAASWGGCAGVVGPDWAYQRH
jgi:hypothetical protein